MEMLWQQPAMRGVEEVAAGSMSSQSETPPPQRQRLGDSRNRHAWTEVEREKAYEVATIYIPIMLWVHIQSYAYFEICTQNMTIFKNIVYAYILIPSQMFRT